MRGLTPAMRQYADIKKRHKDSVLFFRMGDFYETFWDDADTASKELDIVLTSRATDDKSARIPMAGVPYHSVEPYIAKLVKKGYKVAICEQLEDPKFARGIVKRDVVRVITPGTVFEDYLLKESSNNFLAALVKEGDELGLSFVDVSTGEFYTTQFKEQEDKDESKLADELARFKPTECLVPKALHESKEFVQSLGKLDSLNLYPYDTMLVHDTAEAKEYLKKHFRVVSMEAFGCENMPLALKASAAALSYLHETQKTALEHITKLTTYSSSSFMILDSTTLRNLEILRNVRDGTSRNTLLSMIDHTRTSMGSRLLKKWLLQPLMDVDKINKRLQAVGQIHKNTMLRHELGRLLKPMGDVERLVSRVVYGSANPRELLALRNSLKLVPQLRDALEHAEDFEDELKRIKEDLVDLGPAVKLIDTAIVDEPPANIRDGGVIRGGYSKDLDELRASSSEGKKWIAELEAIERRRTGIKSLKVGYNQVFGYYIEVTKMHLSKVPQDYIRKQTLSNCERFITSELKEKESVILGAEEKISTLEKELYRGVLDKIAGDVDGIQKCARATAKLDCYHSFASVAISNDYVRPEVNDGDAIQIKDGRHPAVEKTVSSFVPNDSHLDSKENQLIILTGPNMAGKSTYMRQTALIVLLAQIGSFVPARYASIGVVDRIFTRVGAFDDLTSGQSTFMVEMLELANILHSATPRSLILLDEIGRGTSTFDGLSIAWAVAEYIHNLNRKGVKTIFATHYHQLTDLASTLKRTKNCHIAVKEEKDGIIFLRKVVPGSTDKSYGIQVAKLAGVPKEVLSRSNEILSEIEAQNIAIAQTSKKKVRGRISKPKYTQLLLLGAQEGGARRDGLVKELEALDLNTMTPLEALRKLNELKKRLEETR